MGMANQLIEETEAPEAQAQEAEPALPGPQRGGSPDTYYAPLRLNSAGSDDEDERREYGVSFIKAGWVRRRDGKKANWRIPREAIKAATDRFGGIAVFVDHAMGWFAHPSVKDLAAVTFGATWNDEVGQADGGVRLYNRPDLVWLRVLLDQILEDQAAGRETPDVGLSIVFFGQHEWEGPDDNPHRVTKSIDHVESCDIVFGPGAEGRIREVLSRVGSADAFNLSNLSEVIMPEERLTTNEEAAPAASAEVAAPNKAAPNKAGPGQALAVAEAQRPERPSPIQPYDPANPGEHMTLPQAGVERLDRLETLVLTMAESVGRMQETLMHQATQAAERRVIEEMNVGVAPRDRGPAMIRGSYLSSLDQITRAYEAMMGLDVAGEVQQLTGIRELYLLLTGDRNFRGEFNADLAPDYLAYSSSGNNADTSTMAELTRNVMNKRLIQQTELLQEYYWWRACALVDHFNSLQQVSWVRYGGIGYDTGIGLPTVAEKAEYQQLLWEDERTTADWVKYGGYLPLSLEMIDRDDVAAWRDVPRQLAVAQAVTISSVISALFTANSGAGPALGDGVGDGYAFNTTRGNLINQALDQDTWSLAIEAMYKLGELLHASVSETRRMAVRPRKVLVPIELEGNAVLAVSTPVKAGTFQDAVPKKRTLREEDVITVPHWTNANNWAAIADPNVMPFAGVGFRFGEMPEIFIPADTNHVLWLHDVLPIKTRWFFAVSVVNWRGCIKSNQ